MDYKSQRLHIFFLPFIGHGHMIPMIDMAKLFATRGLKATIVASAFNARFVSDSIEKSKSEGLDIDVQILSIPFLDAALPVGSPMFDLITSQLMGGEFVSKLLFATAMFQEPLEQLMQECKPDCLVSDMFFPWTTDVAAKFAIPRLVFHGTGNFSLCTWESMRLYEPYKEVESDTEPFVVPNLPGDIEFTKNQLPDFVVRNDQSDFSKFFELATAAELKSYGVIINTFKELEPDYVDHVRNVLGRKTWNIGPVSLFRKENEDKSETGHECLNWLDSKKHNSVVYICFGSIANFNDTQLLEIAMGLEASGQEFIWVVKKGKKMNEEERENWLPEGFEKRMEGKGLIIRGWAPQVLILNHESLGGFVTHCGWNSTLESVTAGVPMIAWPLFAEQFYNEKLVTRVLKIGVSVGVEEWAAMGREIVKKEAVEKAVREVMVGDGAEEMRSRAKALGELAKRAVEEGGSSSSDLTSLIEELRLNSPLKNITTH